MILGVLAFSPQAAFSGSLNSELLNGVFSPSALKSSDFTYFPKWTRVTQQIDVEPLLSSAGCEDGNPVKCNIEKWKQAMASLEGKSQKEILDGVNTFINSFRYIEDQNNFGTADYWETPEEFFTRNGDCEDFAIMKYVTLKQLGIPTSSMRIIVLNDLNLKLLHAVLAVQVGGRTYILDNQMPQVVQAKSIHHYQPIFSINEEGWWRHQIVSSSL